MKEPVSWEDNPWFIGGTILAAILLTCSIGYAIHQSDLKARAKDAAYEKERSERPTRDLRNGFVQVNEMNCHPALKGLSKRQKSELTDLDKWQAKNSVECGVVFPEVRFRKERVRAYYPHFSILMWRNHKYDDDPDGPVHVEKINIEDCKVAVGNPGGTASWMTIEGSCKFLDLAL